MKRRLSRMFKKGPGSPSSRHGESSARSSADVLMEDADVPPRLLNNADLDLVGWQRFAVEDEPGCHLLTLQFLYTLKEMEDGISFRFFRKEHKLTRKGSSTLLGFHDTCKINLRKGISGFEKNRFWEDISGAPICKKPRTNDIHKPTPRLMHKLIAMTLFPRGDLRPIREDELIITFAMIRKIKVAPVKCTIRQWLESMKFTAPVECSSLITRIENGLGVISNDQIAYISTPRSYVDESYLVQGHILKYGVDGSLIFFFPSCTNEIPLPNPGYHLYNCHELTIPLQTIEESCAGVSYMDTRNMAINEHEGPTSSTPMQMYEDDWEPTGYAPRWTQAPHHNTGGSPRQNTSENRWQAPQDVQWGNMNSRSPSSSGNASVLQLVALKFLSLGLG
uniref:Uncharacterized protein n=1 Tax=Oryza sativa subsp. japonica TaxID=39947 RepID=Q6UUH2_ORYSJ|nr:hypothetical protein OSJNBa0003M24.20 [Oryza sativa Japonica Group]